MKLPDGPRTPLWLETIQFILRPIEYLEARRDRYGDAFTIGDRNHSPVVYLSHPQAIKEIFNTDSKKLETGRGNKYLQPLLGVHSMAQMDGQPHQRQRRLLMPSFHGERMRAYGKLIYDITLQEINQRIIGKAFPIRPLMEDISLRVILQAIFGLDQSQHSKRLKPLISSFLESISSPINASILFIPALQRDLGPISPWGRFLRLRQQIDRMLYEEIQQRRQQMDSDRTDILTLLLMARDEEGQPMTDAELRDQLITLLIAGHETTATALAWAIYWILYMPEVKSKLLSEINTIPTDADPSSLIRLPYLSAVCSESLRLYPVGVAPFNRIVAEPLQIMDYEFQSGTVLIPCTYLTHQREDLYPEPKQFKPERFLDRQFAPYEYFPFGGGSHACIGMAFAQFEIKLVLATLLRTHDLALDLHRAVKPVRRGPAVAPPDSLRMVFTAKRQPQKVLATL